HRCPSLPARIPPLRIDETRILTPEPPCHHAERCSSKRVFGLFQHPVSHALLRDAAVCFVSVSVAAAGLAQSNTATISGAITDSHGGTIAAAEVIAINDQTGAHCRYQ